MALDQLVGVIKQDLFTFTIYIWLLTFYLWFKNKKEKPKIKGTGDKQIANSNKTKFLFPIAFAIGAITLSYRFIVYPFPQGYDLPFYIYWSELLDYPSALPNSIVTLFGRIVSIIFVKIFITLMGNPYTGLIAINLFFGGLYVAGLYLLMNEIEGERIAMYTVLFTSLSFFYYRLYLDLIANQIAWAFSPYVLLYYLKYRKTKNKKYGYILAVVFTLMFFSHIWSTLILLGGILLDSLMQYVFFGEKKISDYTMYYIVILVLFIIVSLVNFHLIYNIILIILEQLTRGVERRFMFISRESAVILFLGVFGAYYLSTRLNERRSVIYSLYAFVSFLLIVGLFYHPYRVSNLFPFGVMAAYGLDYLIKKFAEIRPDLVEKVYLGKKSWIKPILAIFLVFLVVSTGSLSYIDDHVMVPSQDALNQLWFIRDRFGFNSSDIVVLVDVKVAPVNNIGWSNMYYWLNAIVGRIYYSGTLIDYVQGLERKKLSIYWTESYYTGYDAPPSLNKTLVIPDKWYKVTSLERQFSRYIGNGVYVIENPNPESILNFVNDSVNYYSPLNASYQVISGWDSYLFSVRDGYNNVSLSITPHDNSTPIGLEFSLMRLMGVINSTGLLAIKLDFNVSVFVNTTVVCDNLLNSSYTSTLFNESSVYLSIVITEDVLPIVHLRVFVYPWDFVPFTLTVSNIVFFPYT